ARVASERQAPFGFRRDRRVVQDVVDAPARAQKLELPDALLGQIVAAPATTRAGDGDERDSDESLHVTRVAAMVSDALSDRRRLRSRRRAACPTAARTRRSA